MKSFAIVSALALSLALTACGKKEEAAPVETAPAVETPVETAVTEAAPVDTTVTAEAAPVETAE
jgi:predicted small lipoprotein YifL